MNDTRAGLVSAGLFFSIFLGLYVVYQLNQPLLEHYFAWLAHSVAALVSVFDPSVSARGNTILHDGRASLRVIEGCDGVTVFILIIAAVMAFPKPLSERVIGVLVLVPILFVINWIRLVVLSVIRFYWPAQFDFVHVYLFQPTMILATFVCFIAWIVYERKRSETAEPIGSQ